MIDFFNLNLHFLKRREEWNLKNKSEGNEVEQFSRRRKSSHLIFR